MQLTTQLEPDSLPMETCLHCQRPKSEHHKTLLRCPSGLTEEGYKKFVIETFKAKKLTREEIQESVEDLAGYVRLPIRSDSVYLYDNNYTSTNLRRIVTAMDQLRELEQHDSNG